MFSACVRACVRACVCGCVCRVGGGGYIDLYICSCKKYSRIDLPNPAVERVIVIMFYEKCSFSVLCSIFSDE